jgi:hypothetical protein
MTQLFTVFMMVKAMEVIVVILTVYVTVGENSYFWATKVWNHRQDTERV